jgi:DNA (cytosine-5)-methyltransferase 1
MVDLFSGCGGLTLGLAEASRAVQRGIDVRLAVEWDPEIWDVYSANFAPVRPSVASDARQWFDGKVGARRTNREISTRRAVGSVDFLVGRARFALRWGGFNGRAS